MGPSSRSRAGLALALLAAGTLATLPLAGCGRRGPLELPPGAPPTADAKADDARQQRVLDDNDQPGLIQSPNKVYERTAAQKQQIFKEEPAPRPINSAPPAKPTGFFLDPLL